VTDWTSDDLARIGAVEEMEIAPRRGDGTLRRPVAIWVVRVGDDLYIRSWRGDAGKWFRAARAGREGLITAGGVETEVAFVDPDEAVDDAIDAAYLEKYRRHATYVPDMLAPEARATTLKLVPR
jgi:hypothetical protein